MRDSDESRVADGASPALRIDALGVPEIWVAGAQLTLSDHKARALLLYLAITGQAHTRERLATLLWSEAPESNARHSLRSSLYHLRHTLRGAAATAALLVSRDLVRLRLSEDACDVARFRRLLGANTESAVAEAISLYRGQLLDGFSLADAPVFEDWMRSERTNLDQLYHDALDRLTTWAEAREAWGEAIGYLQRIVQLDSLNEAAQQRLMRLHLRSGAAVRALRQYQQFETELRRELGLAPSPDTQELFQRALRSQRGAEPPARPAAAQPEPHPARAGRESADWVAPFVGRDDTLAQLAAICQDTREGRGGAVLLHGERGMGKTRLLSELAARLAEQTPAWTVLVGSCSPFDDLVAYGPFYDAFQSATSGDLSELLTSGDQGDTRAEAGAVMWRALRALRLLARGGPVMLAIDDLHWANSSTLQMFGFLATHLRNTPVLLVGTIERIDAIPAVRRLLSVGRPHGEVRLAPVTPLTREALREFLQALGLSLDTVGALAEWLQARSGGSPYMLGEILAQLRAEAMLTPSDSGWRFDEGRWLRRRTSFTLPETTYDLIAWRLAPLAPEALHALDVLAVAGQPLSFALLQDFPGIGSDQALSLMDDLLARGLVIEAADETLALPHHLLAETLLSRMSHLRKRAIHRQLLEAIERCPALQKRLPLHQLALHAVAAEDIARAQRYGLPALDELTLSAPCAETLSFAQRLYDLLAPSASDSERLRLTRALGQLHESLGQIDAAKRCHQQQLEIARAAGNLAAQVTAWLDMAELALASSDDRAAVAAAEAGLALIESVGHAGTPTEASDESPLIGLSSRGHRLLGAALAMEGSDLSAADQHLQRAVAVRRDTGDSGDLCAALFELGNVAAQRGDIPRALACYEEAGRAAESERVYYYQALAQNNFAYHSLLLGQVEAASQAANQGLRVAETHELVGALVHLHSTLGEIRLYQAEWARAASCFERGLVLAEELGNLDRQAGHRAGLALVARGERDVERATALLEEALALISGEGHWHLRARIQLWLAETWLLRDNRAAARRYIERAHATAMAQERSLLLVQSERLSARLLAADGVWPEASARFTRSIERATRLGLTIEAARTQAAWGQAILDAPASPEPVQKARELLTSARQVFATHDARADLLALDEAARHRRAR